MSGIENTPGEGAADINATAAAAAPTSLMNALPVQLQAGPTEGQYAQALLTGLGAQVQWQPREEEATAQQRWLSSGLAALTGLPDKPVLTCPVPLASYADGALTAFAALSGLDSAFDIRGADLLTVRAAISGLTPAGDSAPGGSCRLLPTADGCVALNLPRDSDWHLLDAWLQTTVPKDWPGIAARVVQRTSDELVAQGRLLGLAIAQATSPQHPGTRVSNSNWYQLHASATPVANRTRPPRVLDLSSLWAGPLCSQLLRHAGASVIKVESSTRPDGTRQGPAAFYEFLNQGKEELQLDLGSDSGQAELRRLIGMADIVIEGSRPRALRHMGLQAEALIAEVPGLTWLSISGYGRGEPQENWIAYGDDAGVAAGLSALLHQQTGCWLFCGDAIADPFTGIHAALAAQASWRSGGGRLVSLSLVDTLRYALTFAQDPPGSPGPVRG